MSTNIVQCTANIYSDSENFYRILDQICERLIKKVLIESKLPNIENQAKELFADLKKCNKRLQSDIQILQKYLKNNDTFSKQQIFESNSNLRDLALTCDQVLQKYDKFVRKDVEILKNELSVFVNLIKQLNAAIQNYNQTSELKLLIFSQGYDFLNQVVNLGFEITDLKLMNLEDFGKKYKNEFDFAKFKAFLKTQKDPITDRLEYKWIKVLYDYFESV